MPSPLQIIKEQHGSKDALIDKVSTLVERDDGESADEHKKRLKHVSNAKLLHLLALGQKIEKLGGRDKIVARILELRGQPKDHEYGDALKRVSLARLADQLVGLEKATGGKIVEKKAPSRRKAPPTAKPRVAKKTTAKAPAKASKAAKA